MVTVGALAVSGAALSGCASSSTKSGGASKSAGAPVHGGNLTIARAQDAKSMNNILTFDNSSIFIFEQIMEPLFTVTADGKATKPLLATGYKVSADKKTYTINLRKGVKFSTGKEMTSADVKFSIDQDTKHASTGWGFINSAIQQVQAAGKYTVVIKLKHAWAPLIADLALFSNAIVPNNYDGKTMAEFYQAPVGTGPFKWGQWKRGEYLKLVANTGYWQKGKPYLDSVTWNVVPDSNTRKLQVQGGQADIDEYPDWSTFKSLGTGSNVIAKTFPSTELDYLAFNEKKKPFQDVHVRRAISAMIDRSAINKAVLFGNGTPANSLLMPGVPFYQKSTPGIMKNDALAKKELAASSVPKGFSTTLLIPSGDASKLSTAQIIQNDLQQYNIKVTIKQLDPTANHNAQQNMQYDMGLSAWTMDIPDPDEWTSFAIDPDGGAKSAYTNYRSAEAIKLNRQAQQSVDHSTRAELYNQLQDVVAHDAPFAFLYYAPYAYGVSDKVQNFNVTPLGNYPLTDVWKSK
ncbi:ABC transporter substrate-binding protein [Leekyejoonella antrihumi]|nr:ABC transporter substrate-binding protein [Leekyejoonella antrihumi]